MSRWNPAGAALAALAALCCTARAQSWETHDEIAFAKNMARYRLFDLATEHIGRLERSDLPQEDRVACLYARAFIERVGGEYDTTLEARLANLKAAIAHYEEFLGKIGPEHKNAEEARGEAAASQRKLGALLAELAAKGVDEAANRAGAEEAFRSAVKQLNALHNARKRRVDELEKEPQDPNAAEPEEAASELEQAIIEAYEPVYELVATYWEWAQLYGENDFNRADYLRKAVEQAQDYLWTVGTTAFRAYEVSLYCGLAHVALGQVDDGMANLDYITSEQTGAPAVLEENPDLPPDFVATVTSMVERTYLELAKIHARAKKLDQVKELGQRLDQFYAKYAARGAKRGPYGERFLLELGMARFKAGEADGMKLLEEVSNRNGGNDVGARAGELIAEAVRGSVAGDLELPPSTWITTAFTARGQNRFLDAIDAYHHAIGAQASIGDEKERAKTVVDCWYEIGNSYRQVSRHLEAAMAYQEGLAVCGAHRDLDEEQTQQVGIAWYNTLVSRYKETKDARDKRTKDDALRKLASEFNVKNTQYLVAKDEFEQVRINIPADQKEERARAFSEVASQLAQIKTDDANYDRAQIMRARCEGEQGGADPKKYEAALKVLDRFDEYAAKNAPPADKAKLLNREVARVESAYYRSEYLLELKRYEDVLAVLEPFEATFPDRPEFFPEANYRRLTALLALGRLADAEKHFLEVTARIEKGELKPWRDSAGFWLARAYLDAGEKEADVARKKELLRKGGDLMVTYCKATAYSSYNNLASAADAFTGIEDWGRAEAAYKILIEQFGKEAQYRDDIDRRVKRSLAEVMVAQRKFTEAAPLYRELEIRFAKDPVLLRAAARCYGGWVEIEDGRPVEIPGAGDYVHAVELWDLIMDRGFKKEDDKTPPWFEAKFHTIYCRYRAKETDPSYFTQSQKLMGNFITMVWNFFKDDADFIVRLGGETWKRRWDYLSDRLR